MVFAVDAYDRKRKLLEESCILIERLKKLRALSADPHLVGIDLRLHRVEGNGIIMRPKRRLR